MNKIFSLFKEPCFWPILKTFSSFSEQIFFLQIWLCHAQPHIGFQHQTKILKKVIIQFQRKEDGRVDG